METSNSHLLRLALRVGSVTERVSPVSATTRSLQFFYTVKQSDRDDDGISVPANPLSINGAAITVPGDPDTAVTLTHAGTADDATRKVDGSRVVVPTVQAILFSAADTPVMGDTYRRGETIAVLATFDKAVRATGQPQLALTIGTSVRNASFVASPVPVTHVRFHDTVEAGDVDADGISIAANALSLNGGAIELADGTIAADITHPAVAADPARKVDGTLVLPPTVTRVYVYAEDRYHPEDELAYQLGEEIRARAVFDSAIEVTGRPQLALTIGTTTRQATYSRIWETTRMEFLYTVQASDMDDDGISISADALTLNGGSITGTDRTPDAVLTHDAADDDPVHKVDGGASFAPQVASVGFSFTPRSGETYVRGEWIYMLVQFDRMAEISGSPRVALTIGGNTRYATYRSVSTPRPFRLLFVYTVQASDMDDDGISIPANAVELNGGAITLPGVPEKAAVLTHIAVDSDLTRKVDGSLAAAPMVDAVAFFGSPFIGTTYPAGEVIGAYAQFDREVDATGEPQLALAIGANTRQASFVRVWESNSRYVLFSYIVQASDLDDDGISIPADALSLNGGTITIRDDADTDTVLTHSATATDEARKVDGAETSAPVVLDVRFSNAPSGGDTYALREEITAYIQFTKALDVTDAPSLALTIGANTRQAEFQSILGACRCTLKFSYRVQASDMDDDGIEIATDSLSLNGGTIKLADVSSVDAVLSHSAVNADATRKVSGALVSVNIAPVFSEASPTPRTVPENSAVGTNVGAAVTATDADGDTLEYSLEGTDAGAFDIVSTSGQITTKAGVTYDHEAKSSYSVTVKADDGNGGTATTDVSITVTDVDEQSETPAKPTLAAHPNSATSLVASWTKPGLNGGPDILAYAVEYREGTTGTWVAAGIVAVVRTDLTELQLHGLAEGTEYQVRVQAINGETPSDWSDPSDAVSTDATIPPGLEVTLQLSDDAVIEPSAPVTVTATVSPASPVAFTVTISATPVAPATADDFTLSQNRVLRFAANATESTGTVTIGPVDDDVPEPTDVVRVSGAVSNAAIPDPDDVTLTIVNDDSEALDIAVRAPAAVDEDAGAAVVTVTLTTRKNTAPTAYTDLSYRSKPGETATRGDDYTPPPGSVFGGLVHFATVQPSAFSPNAAGTAWVAEPSFTIGIIDDQEAERAETIVFAVDFGVDQSPVHTITIRDNDAVASDRPTGLQAAPKGQTQIQLSWTVPADVGSFAITGYMIEVSENAGATWTVLSGHTGSARGHVVLSARTDYRHVGLSAGDRRHYRVSAISAAGTSAPSNVASATTMAAGPAATNPALPPPQDVNATPILPGEIRLGWWRNPNEPSKGLVDRHQYRYRVRNAGTWTVDWTTVNQTMLPGENEIRNYNSVLLRELTAVTAYEFQVRSVDKADTYSAGVSALATAVGPRTIWIQADTRSVRQGAPLPFTLSRDQPHGRLYVIVRIRETGDTLPPDGRGRDGAWTEGVYFGDGNATIPLVLETVNDLGGSEPDSVVTVEVLPSTRQPNPDNEYLYEVQPDLGSATITVTASAAGPSRGGVAAPLTAEFEGLPEAHDGETAFRFRIAFSEAVTVTPAAMRTRVLTVTGGAVTGAARVDGEPGVWGITVTPATRAALSITLAPTVACEADSAVCTADGRALSIGAAHLVSGPGPETPTQEVQTPLTARFEGVPAAHDGERAFRFRVAFSEDIGISFKVLRDESFTPTGGAVTGARRVDGRNDLWEITVEPSGAEHVTITLAGGRDCGTTGAVCTRGDTPRALTNSPSATVAGPPSDPLTASFSGVPASHDGQHAFTFGLTFSEDVAGLSYKTLRDSAFSETNGQVTQARRKQQGSNQGWTITVKPDTSAAVTIRLPETTNCNNAGAICTDDGRKLNHSTSATIPGPAAALDFAHFAKGATITSEMVLVNAAPHPSRPAIYFYDTKGDPIPAESVVDLTGDLEVTEDGGLTVRTEMEPLEALTISTHGRGEPVTG